MEKQNQKHKYAGIEVVGDVCPRCDKEVKWFGIPDSLAAACKECGFVRVGTGGRYTGGATLQEWLRDTCERRNKTGEQR